MLTQGKANIPYDFINSTQVQVIINNNILYFSKKIFNLYHTIPIITVLVLKYKIVAIIDIIAENLSVPTFDASQNIVVK